MRRVGLVPGIGGVEIDSIHENYLNDNGWRQVVGADFFGLHGDGAFHGGEPEAAVLAAPGGGLIAAGTFERGQAIRPAEFSDVDTVGDTGCEMVQIRL